MFKILRTILLVSFIMCAHSYGIGADVPALYDEKLQGYDLRTSYMQAHSIKEFVEYYAVSVQNLAETELSSVSSIEKELLFLINSIQVSPSISKAVILLSRAESLHERVITSDLSQEHKNVAYEIMCALALRCSLLFTDSARTQILEALHLVDQYLSYWKEQKSRPMHYFFHKSPLKWAMGKKQTKEIRDNIYGLEKLQEKLYRDLGSLTGHMYSFVAEESVEAHFAWIDRLLVIIPLHKAAYEQQQNEQVQACIGNTMENLQVAMGDVKNIKNSLVSLMSSAKKPNHFVRNWMRYAVLGGIAYYALQNPELVSKWIGEEARGKYSESIQALFNDNIVTPVKNTWNVLRGEDHANKDQMKRMQEINKSLKEKTPEIAKFSKELTSDYATDISKIRLNLKERSMKEIKNKLGIAGIAQVDKENILKACGAGDVAAMRQHCGDLKVNGYYNLTSDLELIIQSYIPLFELDIAGLLKSIEDGAIQLDTQLIPFVGQIAGITADGVEVLICAFEDYYNLKKQTQLIAQLLLLIPVGLATWSSTKIYNWMMAHDYSPLRVSLADVQSFFIESVSPLTESSYGKLIYLLHKLKKQAMLHVSTADNVRNDFLTDIAKLESREFSNKNKRLIVENMRSRYSFLSVA